MTDVNLDFDPGRAKRLKPGEFIAFPEAPGLRLEASRSGRRWIYRYRSPIDAALRQIKLGAWPAMPAHRALVAWEKRRDERGAGRDPALERREETQAHSRRAAPAERRQDRRRVPRGARQDQPEEEGAAANRARPGRTAADVRLRPGADRQAQRGRHYPARRCAISQGRARPGAEYRAAAAARIVGSMAHGARAWAAAARRAESLAGCLARRVGARASATAC